MTALGLAAALVAELDDAALDALAEKLAPRLLGRLAPSAGPDGWLDAKSAAAYLSISVHALHKLTAARVVPFEQEGPGCKLWFKPSELDAWRRGTSPNASKSLPNGRERTPLSTAVGATKPRLSGAFS